MKLSLSEKDKKITITPQSYDDIFRIYLLLEEGDELYGWSYRQRKVYDREGRAERGERERVYLGIKVEKVSFDSERGLKVLGSIIQRPEELEASGHHSFNIGVGDTVTIVKKEFNPLMIRYVTKNVKEFYPKSLIVAIDYGDFAIAKLEEDRMQVLLSIKENVGGKRASLNRDFLLDRFIEECEKLTKSCIEKTMPNLVVFYGPSNLKDILYERLKDDLKSAFRVSGSIGGLEGLYEALRNEEVLKILSLHGYEETISLESLLSRTDKIAIGLDEVKRAASYRAVERLIISSKLLKQLEPSMLEELKKLAESIEAQGGKIKIVDENSESGKTLEKFGNLIAILRFNIN